MRLHKNKLPDQGIVYKGAILECWLPSHAQSMLRYNKKHLPVIPLQVRYYIDAVTISSSEMVYVFQHEW